MQPAVTGREDSWSSLSLESHLLMVASLLALAKSIYYQLEKIIIFIKINVALLVPVKLTPFSFFVILWSRCAFPLTRQVRRPNRNY